MPHKCCAPMCKTNYKTGEKASVFSFPKDEISKQDWIAALRREKSFVPTRNTKVCIKHFDPDDIEREMVHYDERTGRTLSAPLRRPRIRPGAVPSIFPNCPKYFTKIVKKRESVEERQLRKDRERTAQAINADVISHQNGLRKNGESTAQASSADVIPHQVHTIRKISITTFNGFREFLNQHPPSTSNWTIVNCENDVILMDIAREPIPKVKNSVIVNNECKISVVVSDRKVKKMGKFNFPFALRNINELYDILSKVESLSQSAQL